MNYRETRQRYQARVDARALRQALEFHNWSYADLARAAGVSKSTVGNLAGGTRPTCTPKTIAKIAKALNTKTKNLADLESTAA